MTISEIRTTLQDNTSHWPQITNPTQLAYEIDLIEELMIELDRLDDGDGTHHLRCALEDLHSTMRHNLDRHQGATPTRTDPGSRPAIPQQHQPAPD